MRRRWGFLLLVIAGCSTAPVADVLDYFTPGRMDKAQVTPYGGVCLQPGKGPPLNAIPIGGTLPPPVFPGPGSAPPPPGVGPVTSPPPPVFPGSPPNTSPIIPVPPPPGLQGNPPAGTVSWPGADRNPSRPPGVVLSLPAIDTNSPR